MHWDYNDTKQMTTKQKIAITGLKLRDIKYIYKAK